MISEHAVSGTERRMKFEELVGILEAAFERNRCSPKVARLLARNCAAAERDGAHSHGVFRMRHYVSNLSLDGWVDGWAVPSVEAAAPAILRVDARNGFAVPALDAAFDDGLRRAREHGVALVAIRNSHHLGALSLDVEPFADQGLMALSVVNSMRAVVPHGGKQAVFGTNPIGFAVPRVGQPPFVIDMATSAMAHGDVQIAAREGRLLPEGTGVDREGKPSNDPRAVLDGGALLPFGGHKGAALSLMVELLCAALVEGSFSAEAEIRDRPGATTPCTGQTVVLIDPDRGRQKPGSFPSRVGELLGFVVAAGQERLPGDRRLACRADSEQRGIPISPETAEILARL